MALDFAALADEAIETQAVDMTQVTKGGEGPILLPEGVAMARLIGYVETGMQPQTYNKQAKDPANEIRLTFALYGAAYSKLDANGKVVPATWSTYWTKLGNNEKSGALKLFQKLNVDGRLKHFLHAIAFDTHWTVKVVHKEIKAGPNKGKMKSELDTTSFAPALNPVTGEAYPLPPRDDADVQVFLWQKPTLEAWNALFIEGQFEATETSPARSKNFIQEKILASLDYKDSALYRLLEASTIPDVPEAAAPSPAAAAPTPAPAVADVAVAIPDLPEAPVA